MVARGRAYFPDRQIDVVDLPSLLDFKPMTVSNPVGRPRGSVIREIENDMIRTRLIANRGNQRRTAADLGIHQEHATRINAFVFLRH